MAEFPPLSRICDLKSGTPEQDRRGGGEGVGGGAPEDSQEPRCCMNEGILVENDSGVFHIKESFPRKPVLA